MFSFHILFVLLLNKIGFLSFLPWTSLTKILREIDALWSIKVWETGSFLVCIDRPLMQMKEKRLRFQLTCTWTRSKMVNETESLQVRIEEKHRAGHWLSCPFHAKSDIWYTCWYRYITAIEISLTSGFSLIIIMVHSSSSLHLHCPPCSLTTVSLFVIFYWKLCIIHFQSLFTLWKFQLDSIFRLGKVSFFQNWWILKNK